MASSRERVFVTGGAGFTGAPLCEALRKDGHHVIAAGRADEECDIRADLLDFDALADAVAATKPTVIVHLAAIAFAPNDDLHRLYTTNVAGSASLLRAAASYGGELKSVILASSAKVYAPPQSDGPISEESPLQPFDHYGVSKWAMEQTARLFADTLPITVVRPFNYTGPGQDPRFFVPKLVHAFVNKQDVTVGQLDVVRDFSDVATVVEVYRRLVASPRPGRVFNICSGQPTPLGEIIRLLRELTGNEIQMSVNQALVRTSEPATILGSSAALEEALGRLPRPTLRETLERMVVFCVSVTA